MATALAESVRALVASREGFVKRSIVRLQHARTTASVLRELASVRKVGRVRIVQSKTKQRFLASQHVQTTGNSIHTLRNAFAMRSLAAMIAQWNFVT